MARDSLGKDPQKPEHAPYPSATDRDRRLQVASKQDNYSR